MHFRCVLVILSVTVKGISTGQQEYDDFAESWPLEEDMSCIHREHESLGLESKSKPEEPNKNGNRTYCYFVPEIVPYVNIGRWPPGDGFLELAFIERVSQGITYAREGEKIDECKAMTEINGSLPKWIGSSNATKINQRISNRCFYWKYHIGPEPIKVVFKVFRKSDDELEGRTIKYILPKRSDYKVYQRESELKGTCTRCATASQFKKTSPAVASSSNLTHVLQKLKEAHIPNLIKVWPLEVDLPCSHVRVHTIGSDQTARTGEPNWNGKRTYCFFHQEIVSYTDILEWPAGSQRYGIAFVERIAPTVSFAREGDNVTECRTLTEISSLLPGWVRSNNATRINRKIRNNCFFLNYDVRSPEVIKVVFKLFRKANAELEARTIKYILPNRPDYLTVKHETELNDFCTRCVGGGGFAQPIIVNGFNATRVLKELAEKHRRD